MNDNQELAHNIKNDLFIIKCLVKKLNINSEIIDKINEIIKHSSLKCTHIIHPEKMNSETINLNLEIEKALERFPDIDFKKCFHEELLFVCNKIHFQDALSNIILNSIQAGASTIILTIINKSLIITDSGSCTYESVKKLNSGNAFTTKEHGSGIGSKSISEFFNKYNCKITYSISAYQSMIVSIIFP